MPKYMTASEVAETINVSPKAVQRWNEDPTHPFPKAVQLFPGQKGKRWIRSEIERYLADRKAERDREQQRIRKVLPMAG
jgi:predicted DNA-binding transcriptional regulator AlpA